MAQKRTAYKNQYVKDNYERINLFVDLGMKDIIKETAKNKGKSVNSYINDAIKKSLIQDGIDLDALEDKDAHDPGSAL